MVPLSYFVQQFAIYNGELSTNNDQRNLQMVIDCLKKLAALKMMDFAVKRLAIPIQPPDSSGNRWAYLPKDYKNYIQIGCCRFDRFIAFDINEDLCMNPVDSGCSCNNETFTNFLTTCCNGGAPEVSNYLYSLFGMPYSYSYAVGNYSIGPGQYRGGFNIVKEQNIILFDQCVLGETFILYYIGDFLNEMGNCLVPDGINDNMIIPYWLKYITSFFSTDQRINAQSDKNYRAFFKAVQDYNSQINQQNYSIWLDLARRFDYQNAHF